MKTKDLADIIKKKRKEQKLTQPQWQGCAMWACVLLLIWKQARKPVRLAMFYMFWICWELS